MKGLLLSTALVVFSLGTFAAAQCSLPSTNKTVHICSPSNGSTVTSPVSFSASAFDSSARVTAMAIYLDNVKVYTVSSNQLSTSLSIAEGTHNVTIKAWDATGASFSSAIKFTVSSTAPPPPPPPPGGGATCTLSTVNPSVTVCSPTNNSSVTSPVHVNAGSTDSTKVTSMQIYQDGKLVYKNSLNYIDTDLTMSSGVHKLTIKGWDSSGRSFSQVVYISVSSTPPPPPPPPPDGLSNLKHIIFMLQENRSTDQYFSVFSKYRTDRGLSAEFDGMPLSVQLPDMSGDPVSPFHYKTVCEELLSPAWNESHYDYHDGKMDRFMKTTGSTPSTIDPDGTRVMGYWDSSDLPYYYELAFNFATSDRWFSSLMSNTIPNRMYLFAATSFGHVRSATPPSGGWPQKTIFDALDEAGVSWRYYYQDNSVYLAEWSTWQRDKGKVYPISSYYTDIQNEATLPQVIFIERASASGLDEHTGNNVQKGSARVAEILNALMASETWPSSAFILTFDEAGGTYDHVPPVAVPKPDSIAPILKSTDLPGDFNQTGFRVPLWVVSPWVKPHYVSHTPMELTSILKLIETRFNVPPLTARDANAPDMTEFFDFNQPAWLTPPPLPPQPTTGTCDFNLEKAPGH
jgi:phospholipase C